MPNLLLLLLHYSMLSACLYYPSKLLNFQSCKSARVISPWIFLYACEGKVPEGWRNEDQHAPCAVWLLEGLCVVYVRSVASVTSVALRCVDVQEWSWAMRRLRHSCITTATRTERSTSMTTFTALQDYTPCSVSHARPFSPLVVIDKVGQFRLPIKSANKYLPSVTQKSAEFVCQ